MFEAARESGGAWRCLRILLGEIRGQAPHRVPLSTQSSGQVGHSAKQSPSGLPWLVLHPEEMLSSAEG